MKEELLIKAKLLGCVIDQDSSKKWIIKSLDEKETWLIEEKKPDKWMISSKGIPQMFMETTEVLDFLEILAV